MPLSDILRQPLRRLRTLLFPRPPGGVETQEVHDWRIDRLQRDVRLDVYLPPYYYEDQHRQYPFVLFNDGQDLPGMRTRARLEDLYQRQAIPPAILVGIYAGDRPREYATAGRLDYRGRGDRAAAYERFVRAELLPFLHRRYRLSHDAHFAGFSLGGLSAFDIVWRNPGLFRTAGVFSGALWWRSKPFRADQPDADRILHTTIANAQYQPGLRFWFQAGTEDETSDRNQNGVIDAIDDTLDLMRRLEQLGYHPQRDMHYREVAGGRHEPATWAEVLPEFLVWALNR